MGFRLFPRLHPRYQMRRTFRAGPLRLHVGPDGVSWGLGAGRWSWNAKPARLKGVHRWFFRPTA